MNHPNAPLAPGHVSRRGFLKSTSTAVAGGALLSTLPVDRFALGASPGDTLKIALIGCGGRGTGAANQALHTSGSVQLVAAADAFKDRLEGSLNNLKNQHKDKIAVPDDHKFVGFDAYKQAIALADVVVLATPPGFRPIHFEEAIRQGKHVFMEKPVAVDGPGVRKVLAAAEEAKRKNLKVGVGLQRRHQQVYLATIKRLQEEAIGKIQTARVYWNDAGVWVNRRQPNQTEMEYQMRNWYYFVWLSGDHIVEQHIHNLDVINWIKNGHPIRCHGMGGRQVRTGIEYGEIFDHHAVEYEYADGTRMFSQCRHIPGAWSNVSEHVIGTKGTCNVGSGQILGDNPWRFRTDQPHDAYQTEHDDLFRAIRDDQPYNEAILGAESSLTAIMGRMATYSGKMIEWDAALNSKIDVMPKAYAWDATPPVLPDKDGRYPIAIPGKTITV